MARSDASGRALTPAERAAISPGLLAALARAGADPRIIAAPSLWARMAAIWRGATPIMVLGARIYWPGAPGDLAPHGPHALATLQHELQHVLDFATGRLGRIGYVLWPGNWIYRYRLTEGARWDRFGAEQRAALAEDYWRATHGEPAGASLSSLRGLIPWAAADHGDANISP